MERTAIAKPGMALYAPEDLEGLMELHDELAELQKALIENTIAVTTSRQTLGNLSAVTTAYAKSAAANLADAVEKTAVQAHGARAQAERDHRPPRPRQRRGPRHASTS